MMSVIQFKTESTASEHEQRWERFERKFFVPPAKIPFARGLLSHICLRDSKYPKGIINSLYFDTPDLDHFRKSDDGNYEREKIRIRWYDRPSDWESKVTVYLELKAKRGFASRKQRRRILVSAERLKRIRAYNTILNGNVISGTLSEFGYFPEEPLQSVILITYERFRFTEILTGTRVSFDCRISSSLTATSLGHSQTNLILEGGIIEIKGPSMEIPKSLGSLSILGVDWTRFSKYAACLESQMEESGTVGRLWPSGRIELL
jgi:hypothetical protein